MASYLLILKYFICFDVLESLEFQVHHLCHFQINRRLAPGESSQFGAEQLPQRQFYVAQKTQMDCEQGLAEPLRESARAQVQVQAQHRFQVEYAEDMASALYKAVVH